MKRPVIILAFMILQLSVQRASAQPSEVIEYYGRDASGSTRIIFSPDGTVKGRQDYGPFGRALFTMPTMPKEGFVGQEMDAEDGLAYFHARMFQTKTGRFGSPDVLYQGLFQPQRWNRYAYALNNPSTYTDSDGLSAQYGSSSTCSNPGFRTEFRDFCLQQELG